ncbi:hypothetical protein NQ315_008276 [Exocentrus adspersus]|uniref:DUF7869 domain-containing protein n=1 Tax=Exocentrus adspersus TaxID=1586481 RepID=A0AAV8VN07_9CUCU|nr:hypothetical protein NQ315_008276 [Exocentrus adspersus]
MDEEGPAVRELPLNLELPAHSTSLINPISNDQSRHGAQRGAKVQTKLNTNDDRLMEQFTIDYGRRCVYMGALRRHTLFWQRGMAVRPPVMELPKELLIPPGMRGIRQVLEEFADVFGPPVPNEMSLTTYHQRPYPMNARKAKILHEQIEEMLAAGMSSRGTRMVLAALNQMNGSNENISKPTSDHEDIIEPDNTKADENSYTPIDKVPSDYSEDDDDSVKDPNFDNSSSNSSSSSGSSHTVSSGSSSSSSEEGDNVDGGQNLENEENQIGTKKNTRKRLRNEAGWEKNKLQKLRNEGKEYVSSAKSKRIVSAKKIKEPCNEKCRLKCTTKFTDQDRLLLFNEYYGLSSINRKRDFLSKNMDLINPKYRYQRNESHRRLNYAFSFPSSDGKKTRVCKTFFKSTLDINDRTILTVRNKTNSCGIVSEDMRGKHANHKRISNEIKDGVRNHIKSIPRIESHYLRAQTTKEFIDGGKTIADLHRDYQHNCESEGKPSANYHMYSDIFNKEFNISFFVPKKDQCSLCYQYNTSNDDGKKDLQHDYEEHLKEKVLSREEKGKDKSLVSDNLVVVCFDMQAVLQVPKGEISIFYYKSKLNTMNFTITEIGTNVTNCYVWHEGEGGKGATEVGSCLLRYLEEKANQVNNEDLEFVLYSDNCGAQQKNRYVIAVLMYAVQKLKIRRITHKYLVAGHTQNEGDAVHSVIEKQIAKSLKSGPLYIPDQFISLIRVAKRKGPPYLVHELTHDDFVDVKLLAADVGVNISTNSNKEPVHLSKVHMVKVEKDKPFLYFYKTSYSEEDWKTVNTKKLPSQKATRSQASLSETLPSLPNLQKAYKTKLVLNENKRRDLQFLLQKNCIPQYYKSFYESLF